MITYRLTGWTCKNWEEEYASTGNLVIWKRKDVAESLWGKGNVVKVQLR